MVFDLLSPIAGLIGAGVSSYGQSKTNSANAQLARDQMNFQERMSNTAWQRAVKDMRKAGINPGLAYSQGGASSPVGAMPALSNPYESVHGAASNSAQSYRANQLMMSQLDMNRALTDVYKTQAVLNSTNSAATTATIPGLQFKNSPLGLGLNAFSSAKDVVGTGFKLGGNIASTGLNLLKRGFNYYKSHRSKK